MNKIRLSFWGLAAAALLVGASSLAQAQYYGNWQPTGEANWTNPANWLDSGNNPGVPTQPTDSATIANGGTADVNTATVVGGMLTVGPGAVNQSAGTLNSGVDYIEGAGTFFQSGGLNLPYSQGTNGLSNHSTLYLGSNFGTQGNYQLSGGSIEAELQLIGVGGPGVFTQTGGVNGNVNPPILYLGTNVAGPYYTGTYNLQGGLLQTGVQDIGSGGAGTFNQSGGTNDAIGGGNLPGNYDDEDGILDIGGNYSTARGGGTYNLSGGLLQALNATNGVNESTENVGNTGTGYFVQTGGTNLANGITVQGSATKYKNSSYTLSNTGLVITAYESVYGSGANKGYFTQTGGTNTVTNAAGFNLSGVYNLGGGLLQLPGWGYTTGGAFNFTGGTLQATGPLNMGSSITLGSAGTGTLDVKGQQVKLIGVTGVNAGGALNVIDSHGGGSLLINGSVDGTVGGPNFTTAGIATTIAPAPNTFNSGTISLGGLITASNLTTLAFQFLNGTGGLTNDLLTIGSGGLTVNPNTDIAISYIDNTGTQPTLSVGNYDLIGGNITGANLANFVLPTAPAGETYSLSTVADPGYIDLVVAPVPEPGSLALLGAGLMSLLGYAWRRRITG